MRKHFLAIVAIVLILAATACTQYPDDWKDYFPNMPESNTIKTIEDLYLFLASDGDGEAEVNLTTDLSWFPITVRGNKTITGKLNVTKSASSDITPPQSAVTRSASAKVLFEIEDGAAATLSNFTVSIPSEVTDKVASVVSVDAGTIKADNFNVVFSGTTTVTGITIGDNTAAANVSITNSKPGKIDIANGNKDSDDILKDITDNNTDIPQEDISTRFDAASATEFITKFSTYGHVRLLNDIEDLQSFDIPTQVTPETEEGYIIDLNNKSLTINVNSFVNVAADQTVSFKNGELTINRKDSTNPTEAVIKIYGGKVNMTDVIFKANLTGILAYSSNSKLFIDNSTVEAYQAYAISTNASDNTVSGIEIKIQNDSIIKSDHQLGSAILFNINGILDIDDSAIEAGAQALIVRGGTATINNSRITSRGTYVPDDDLFGTYWESGNSVAVATVVVGNYQATSGYKYMTNCDLTGSTILLDSEASNANQPAIFVASTEYNVYLSIDEPYATMITEDSLYQGDQVFLNSKDTPL